MSSAPLVDHRPFSVISKLGYGANGAVFHMRKSSDQTEYVVKIFSYQMDEPLLHQFLMEVEIMHKLQHPNIVQFVGFFLPDSSIQQDGSMTLEYVDGPTLSQAISTSKLSEDHKIKIISGIALAMAEIHSLGYMHRDLRPSNVLLTKNCTPKLIDFGLARMNDLTNTPKQGCYRYMAPEIAACQYDNKVDVFSFALLMYELFFGPIFAGETDQAVLQRLCSGERPPIPMGFSHWVVELIEKCWSQSPMHRPSFTEIIQEIRANRPKYVDKFEIQALRTQSKEDILAYVKEMLTRYDNQFADFQKQSQNKERVVSQMHHILSKREHDLVQKKRENEELRIQLGQQKSDETSDTDPQPNVKKEDADWSSIPIVRRKGIFRQIQRITGKDVQVLGEIEVKTSSSGVNIAAITDWSMFDFYCEIQQKKGWICFDFKTKRISITGYEIQTINGRSGDSHMKNWVIECSESGMSSWEVIDSKENNKMLNFSGAIVDFAVSPPTKLFRYVRLRQTGPNHYGTDSLCLKHFDLFGLVYL